MRVLSNEAFDEISFTTQEGDDAKRLDALIASHAEGLPRSASRDAISKGHVSVEGIDQTKLKPSLKVGVGLLVRAKLPKHEERTLQPSETIVPVLYEDEHVIVFNKPAGMATHPQLVDDNTSLASVILRHCPTAPCADDEELRPGVVHRLDADTTGAIVVAKTAAALENLKAQFRLRKVEKRYLALVHGTPKKMQMTCDTPIARDPTRPTAMRLDKVRGKPAQTEIRGIERFRGFALQEAVPTTGRTHQIRVHFEARGYPIVADRLYSKAGVFRLCDINPEITSKIALIERQALHAALLSFDHPESGQRLEFQAPLPEDFSALLEAMREFAPW